MFLACPLSNCGRIQTPYIYARDCCSILANSNIRVTGSVGRLVDNAAAIVYIANALSLHLSHGTVTTVFRAYVLCALTTETYVIVVVRTFGYRGFYFFSLDISGSAPCILFAAFGHFFFSKRVPVECCTCHGRSLFRSSPTRKVDKTYITKVTRSCSGVSVTRLYCDCELTIVPVSGSFNYALQFTGSVSPDSCCRGHYLNFRYRPFNYYGYA